MRRREFIAGLGGAVTWPLVARGQQATLPIVGLLLAGSSDYDYGMAAMLEGLKEGGYVEGRNVTVEYRFADGRNDRFPAPWPISFGGK
jgi:putative tryptophan/tyrosine transport system substrate-binding protein